MTSLFRAGIVVLLAVVVAACGEVREPIRIGSQDFTEQKLLAEMMALLAEQAGVDVGGAIPYGENPERAWRPSSAGLSMPTRSTTAPFWC